MKFYNFVGRLEKAHRRIYRTEKKMKFVLKITLGIAAALKEIGWRIFQFRSTV